ncbi:hypothetical protein J6590_015268 [Homalodisca vitripennis]|nr:hypothetical protein J6590_015268 [Homalodisca vitripennis]
MLAGLQEAHEELQAMILSRGVEEGRNLLSSANESHSLAAELDDMSHDDRNVWFVNSSCDNAVLRSVGCLTISLNNTLDQDSNEWKYF